MLAYHEAGHLIMVRHLGGTVLEASFGDAGTGYVRHDPFRSSPDEKMALVAAAGIAATTLKFKPEHRGASSAATSDREEIERRLRVLDDDRSCDDVVAQAREYLTEPWQNWLDVQEIAGHLSQRGTLTGEEINDLLGLR